MIYIELFLVDAICVSNWSIFLKPKINIGTVLYLVSAENSAECNYGKENFP